MADKTFIVTGVIHRVAKVKVTAPNKTAAIKKAEFGDFEVVEEFKKETEFMFNGNKTEHVEEGE